MSDPLISIVIPTHGRRAELLTRAIRSAADGIPRPDMEIILVPNGNGSDWKVACDGKLDAYPLVVVEQAKADRIAARVTGLRHARGQIVRFLDDDDYLFPEPAVRQYDTLLSDVAKDVCSGPIAYVDSDGSQYGIRQLPATTDFIESVLLPTRLPLFFAHVFRASLVKAVGLPMDVSRAEDAVFLMRLCSRREIRWTTVPDAVGAWCQHARGRTSSQAGFRIGRRIIAAELLKLYGQLDTDNRMTPTRSVATTRALWECVHHGFPFSPLFWYRFGRKIERKFPNSYPHLLPIAYFARRHWDPVLCELLFAPARRLSYSYRRCKQLASRSGYRRGV